MSYVPLGDRGISASVLNKGTDDELLCCGYCSTLPRTVRYFIVATLTVGFSLLLFYWKPTWGVKFRKRSCVLGEADTLILKNIYGELSVVSVVEQPVSRSFPRAYCYTVHNVSSEEEGSSRSSSTSSLIDDTTPLRRNEGFLFRYFIHHHIKYYWEKSKNCFERLRGYDSNVPCNDLLEKFNGQSIEQQLEKLQLYGRNSIDIEVKSYFRLFVEEVMNPFYIFQIFSIVLWFVDDYMYFAGCILLITSISMAISLYEIRRQSKVLHDMVSSANAVTVSVLRSNGETEEVASSDLVPGDVLIIPPYGCTMSCDAVMISGSCIVNESMLTGESVPVMKTQLPHQGDQDFYDPDDHKRHTVFCGTQVIQTRFYGNNQVKAVIVRTGFTTAKGELVRSILFPRPLGFKFYRDAMRFVAMLFVVAMLGNIYATYIYIVGHFPVKKMIIRLLDIITIVVPPSLPAAMTVGSVYAQSRLRKQDIFCISPPRIIVCGKIKLFCFDKTGTLTEEGLDLWGIIPVEIGSFRQLTSTATSLDQFSPLVAAMATCHSLTMIDGELRGDPLDLKMFEATSWIIEEPGEDTTRYDKLCPVVVYPSNPPAPSTLPFGSTDLGFELVKEANLPADCDEVQELDTVMPSQPMFLTKELRISEALTVKTDLQIPYEIGIVRQFTFSSNLQRMSVITRTLGKPYMDLYAKGAPEKIISLCLPETVPSDFTARLESYAVQGFRVIALAWRQLDSKVTWHQAQRIKREEVEQQLTFLGLLVMQNTLKPETTPVIHMLKSSNIRTVMATGDNMHTAISVARECGMIGPSDTAIIVTASNPEVGRPAQVVMEYAEKGATFAADLSASSNGQGSTSIDVDIKSAKYHLCMTGRSFATIRQYFPDLVHKIVVRGTVFARMSPDQKAQLVKELQGIGYIVGMCGDGANDCGALKMANVGISLSEAEASVAAPFTSKIPNVECVPIAIREGRCALVTSFGIFKYMALYSMIQFISVLILYTYKTNLGDQQFLYIDLGLATIMALVMGNTKPYEHLVKERPKGSLVSPPVVTSIVCQILNAAAFQIGAILFLKTRTWYVPTSPDYKDNFEACWEANVIFAISSFQYVTTALVFSKGPPFRQPFYKNVWMMLSLVGFTATNVILMVYPFSWLETFFQLEPAKDPEQQTFRLWLLGFPVVNFILSVLIEIFTSSNVMRWISRTLRRKRQPKNVYKVLEKQLDADKEWPTIGDSSVYTSSHGDD